MANALTAFRPARAARSRPPCRCRLSNHAQNGSSPPSKPRAHSQRCRRTCRDWPRHKPPPRRRAAPPACADTFKAPTCGSGFPACYPARAPILLRILTLPCISAPPLLLASPMTSPTDSRRLLPIFCSMLHKQQPCRHYTACAGSACPGSCPRAATMPATRPSPSAEADQRRGFAAAHGSLNFYPFQSSDMTRMLCVVNSSHYLLLSGLGALRACCLPWM